MCDKQVSRVATNKIYTHPKHKTLNLRSDFGVTNDQKVTDIRIFEPICVRSISAWDKMPENLSQLAILIAYVYIVSQLNIAQLIKVPTNCITHCFGWTLNEYEQREEKKPNENEIQLYIDRNNSNRLWDINSSAIAVPCDSSLKC